MTIGFVATEGEAWTSSRTCFHWSLRQRRKSRLISFRFAAICTDEEGDDGGQPGDDGEWDGDGDCASPGNKVVTSVFAGDSILLIFRWTRITFSASTGGSCGVCALVEGRSNTRGEIMHQFLEDKRKSVVQYMIDETHRDESNV